MKILLTLTNFIICYLSIKQYIFNSIQNNNLVSKLQQYIQFDTVSDNGKDFKLATNWLKSYIIEIGLNLTVVTCSEQKPVLIGSWLGKDLGLKTILLNSHYDVVPASREFWNSDPFGGELGEYKGEPVIYGRGSQDDKSLTIMQLEAIRELKQTGFKPNRSIHLTIVPDEETTSEFGWDCLIKDPIFDTLNIGSVLDEGFPSQDDKLYLYYGERAPWNLLVTAKGDTGHSSKFINNLAINKLSKFMNFAEKFRSKELKKLKDNTLGELTTINLVKLGGGTANNVVPDTLWAQYNIRLSPTLGSIKLRKILNKWSLESGVQLKFDSDIDPTISPHNSQSNFYNTIVNASKELEYNVKTQIFPGATDSRILRNLGISSYSLTPCRNTEIRAHDHNEYLPLRCLEEGKLYYEYLVPKLTELENL